MLYEVITMECPKCKATVGTKARYCDQCGVNLEQNAEFLHEKALENYHRGQIDAALKLWDDAISVKGDFTKGYYYRGLALYDRGDLQEAVVA